jgi:hypothetical protein
MPGVNLASEKERTNYLDGTVTKIRSLNPLTFVDVSSFCRLMSPDNLLVRVHSRNSGRERVPSAFSPPSLQLTTASVFDSRRARPFVEDLRCRKVGQLGVLETEKPFADRGRSIADRSKRVAQPSQEASEEGGGFEN